MAHSEDGTEISVASAYCVVYRLEKGDWKVTGEGWAQVHLYQDKTDATYRIVGWTVVDFNVVVNVNVTGTCKYKKKSDDFHKFQDEDDNVYGFGFYKKEESFAESNRFMQAVIKAIGGPVKPPPRPPTASGSGSGSSARPANPSVGRSPSVPSSGNAGSAGNAANVVPRGRVEAARAALAGPNSGSGSPSSVGSPSSPLRGTQPPKRAGPPALPSPENTGSGTGQEDARSPFTRANSVSAIKSRLERTQSVSGRPGPPPLPASATASASGSGSADAEPHKPSHSRTASAHVSGVINKDGPVAASIFGPRIGRPMGPPPLPSGGGSAPASPPPLTHTQSASNLDRGHSWGPGAGPAPITSGTGSVRRPPPPLHPTPSVSSVFADNGAGAGAGAGAAEPSVPPSHKKAGSKHMPSPSMADLPHIHEASADGSSSVHLRDSKTMDDIYQNRMVPLGKLKILPPKPNRTAGAPLDKPQITDPYSIIHTQHVKYNPDTRQYHGLPADWEQHLKKQFGLRPEMLERVRVAGYRSRIPTVLVQMKDYLFKHGGHHIEGIFRLAPDGDESTYVKQQLNENKFVSCDDVNCISNLIKVWFRDLPEHMLDKVPNESIVACDSEDKAGAIVLAMREPQASILCWLLDLCCDVSAHSAINKMTPQNLAIVIGPNLFTSPVGVDPMQALIYSQKVAGFMHQAILWRQRTGRDHRASVVENAPSALDINSGRKAVGLNTSVGKRLTDEHIRDLKAKADADLAGSLSFDDMKLYLELATKCEKTDLDVRNAFGVFAGRGQEPQADPSVDVPALKHALMSLGDRLTKEQVDAFFATPSAGQLSLSAFMAMATPTPTDASTLRKATSNS